MLRNYDKGAESKGRINANRIELQCRSGFAQMVMDGLCDTFESNNSSRKARMKAVARFVASAIDCYVSFRDVTTERSRKETHTRKRCEWWSRVVGRPARVRMPEKERSHTQKYVANSLQQTAGRIRVLLEAAGSKDDFWKLLEAADVPLSEVSRHRLAEVQELSAEHVFQGMSTEERHLGWLDGFTS